MQPNLSEKRAFPRYCPEGLMAEVVVGKPPSTPTRLHGKVLDVSCNGIKIQLSTPFPDIIQEDVEIWLKLPETGIPVTIKGRIRYFSSSTEFGLFCGEDTPIEMMDRLLFECFKKV